MKKFIIFVVFASIIVLHLEYLLFLKPWGEQKKEIKTISQSHQLKEEIKGAKVALANYGANLFSALIRQQKAYQEKIKDADPEIIEFAEYYKSIRPDGTIFPEYIDMGFCCISQQGVAVDVLIEYRKWKEEE